jgi:CRISPR-associated endonuclease/helicase Cas3
VPHNLVSVLFVVEDKLESKFGEQKARVLMSAIQTHHWRKSWRNPKGDVHNRLRNLCSALLSNHDISNAIIQNIINNLSINGAEDVIGFIGLNTRVVKGVKKGTSTLDYYYSPYNVWTQADDMIRKAYVYVAGFLKLIDRTASWSETNRLTISDITSFIHPTIYSKVVSSIEAHLRSKGAQEIWQLKKASEVRGKNVCLIAPPGIGKTEFMFLLAAGNRLVYMAPFRVACNQTYERALLHHDTASIIHSSADTYLNGEQTTLTLDTARNLISSCIITTADQLVIYALRLIGYDMILAALSSAYVLVDEIQAYEPASVAVIIKFLKDVHSIGGNICISTATCPAYVLNKIKEVIPDIHVMNIYEEQKDKLENIKKHNLCMHLIKQDKEECVWPNEIIQKIIELANQGNKVLVIANTIKQSQNIYRAIKSILEKNASNNNLLDNLYLLHSEFTIKDKQDKENIIKDAFSNSPSANKGTGQILIATQVIEAALDINADYLFTEIAPFDSLVQRMGRTLRHIRPESNNIPEILEPNVHVLVFEKSIESGKGKVYRTDILLMTLKLLGLYKIQHQDIDAEYRSFVQKTIDTKDLEGLKQQTIQEVFDGTDYIEIGAIAEYAKYYLHNLLYELPREHNIIQEMEYMLSLIISNYSTNNDKAQEIFRQIRSIPCVPKNLVDELIQASQDFLSNANTKIRFKNEVLNKVLVNVNYPMHLQKQDKIFPLTKHKQIQQLLEQYPTLKYMLGELFYIDAEYSHEEGLLKSFD